VYSEIHVPEPDRIIRPFPNALDASAVLDTYLEAIAGAQKAAGLNTIVATGTYQAYGIPTKYPFEIWKGARMPLAQPLGWEIGGLDHVEARTAGRLGIGHSCQGSGIRAGLQIRTYTAYLGPRLFRARVLPRP